MTDASKADKVFKDWKLQMWMGQQSYEQGQYVVAEHKFRKALADLETAKIGDERLAVTLSNLALCYCAQGKHKDSDPLYQKVLSIDESSGSSSKLMLAEDFSNIAAHYRKQGKDAQAEPLYRKALKIWEDELGEDSADVARGLHNLGLLCIGQGRSDEAIADFKKALSIKSLVYGSKSKEYAETAVNLAATYCELNRCTEADPLFDEGIRILEYTMDPVHPELIEAMEGYLKHLRKVGRTERVQEIVGDIEGFKNHRAQIRSNNFE